MTHRAFLCLTVIALAACGGETEQSFDVGEHHVQIVVPSGWERVDQGRQVLLRRGGDQLILTDLGPSRPGGLRKEIEHIRSLWRDGTHRQAMTRLDQLPQGKHLFAAGPGYQAFREAWTEVAYSPADSAWSTVDARFQHLLNVIDTMKPAPVETVAEEAADRLEHLDHRRELRSSETRRVDGKEAVLVTTWMTLTHADERLLLLVINDGRSLALRCDRCDAPVKIAFTSVAESLHFGAGARR
jgi:hypothetical protein